MPKIYDKDQVKQVADALRETQVADATANDALVVNAQRTLERAQSKLAQAESSRDNLHGDPHWPYLNSNQRAFMGDQAYDAVAQAKSALDLAHNEYDAVLRDYHKRVQAEQSAQKEAEAAKKFEAQQKVIAEREEAAAKAVSLSLYLQVGGTSAQHEKEWPGFWAEELKERLKTAKRIKQNLQEKDYHQL